ncbi:putative helicase [Ralstonia phage RSP15]|uniref:DNA helicase n=1 Tax=Ralstonia phage RSP15 TaxID=1785960 RepID=UPI00074D3768|nr:DNA helicase [Ralstonia phage RSP15]BAU40011.1 putative helicase [Ralstonia phage RSP15]
MMEKDILIERTNASTITVIPADEGVRTDIYEYFKYKEPTFKKGPWTKWDGTVRLYNKHDFTLPHGMLQPLLALAKDRRWTMEVDPSFKDDFTKVTMDDLIDWVDGLELHSGGKPIEAYEYQIEALYEAVRYNRLVALAATSAGKSAIQYMLTRYYEMLPNPHGRKTLIIVPSINLVTQMFNDFKDYSSKNGWSADANCHLIYDGATKFTNKPVIISTWQSLFKMDEKYFEQFNRVMCDEVHGASAESISKIMKSCVNAYHRVGLTGTLKDEQLHPLLVQSHFGPIKRIVTTQELIAEGRATPTNITIMNLQYPEEQRKFVSKLNHHEEIEYLIDHSFRNKVIESLIMTLKGNSLLLFGRVDSHLKIIAQNINAKNSGKKVFVITGQVSGKERDEIKAAIEAGDDIALLATYGTMSTGVSIKKLHNLVFCHPIKSIIKVLQSIGRLLRLHNSKDIANIYDIVDDLKFGGKPNYVLGWSAKRFMYYRNEGHPVKVKKIEVRG